MNEETITSALKEDLSKYLKEELSKETETFSQQFLDNLKMEIKLFLLEIDNIMFRFNHEFQLSVAMDKNDDEAVRLRRFIIARQMINSNSQIEQLLKTGYSIIDELRTAFTGEEVRYFIGVTANHNKELYEGYLTMKEILALTRLEPIWKNSQNSVFKLRFAATKKSLIDKLQPASKEHSKLYSAVTAYASAHGIKNEGNIFEAYRVISSEKDFANKVEEEQNEMIEEVISATRKNTASFAKGGDFLDESIKFFGGSNPSLASLSTIRKILSSFAKVLELPNTSQIKMGLSALFEKNFDLDSLSTESLKEYDTELNDLLKTLQQI